MTRKTRCLGFAVLLAASAYPASTIAEMPPPATVSSDAPLFLAASAGAPAWDIGRVPDRDSGNIEFPHLARFRDYWYLSFREGNVHGNHISGRGRVIRSADGVTWESVGLFESDTGDVRDPRLSVTADGQLMVNASIAYIPEAAPREVVDGVTVTRRSVTWLSDDGENWSGPHFCPTGINTWRWDVAWHEGFGYSIGYSGRDRAGTLYRTRDGKAWESWRENIFPGSNYNEAALSFSPDGTAWCLLRGGGREATLGSAPPPYDGDWTWRKLDVAWHGSDSRRPYASTRARNFGGPNLITLADGRLLGAARAGDTGIFLVDPEDALMTRLISVQGGGSYPGLAEHEGEIWFSYSTYGTWRVYLARARIPGRASFEDLAAAADELLTRPAEGFGSRYRRALADARASEITDERRRAELHRALAEYEAARAARDDAAALLAHASRLTADESFAGFEARPRQAVEAAAVTVEQMLDDGDATIESLEAATARLDEEAAVSNEAARLRAAVEAALAEAGALPADPDPGYQSLLRDLVARRADRLRLLMQDAAAQRASVAGKLERLREALAEILEVPALPAAPEIAATGIPARARPQAGLLVNARTENAALRLANEPVLAFTGKGDWVDFGNPPEIAGLSRAFTISAWAYPESTDESYRTILIKGDGPFGHNGFYLRHGRTLRNRNHAGVNVFSWDDPQEPYGVNFQPADPPGFDHRWHHYSFTFDGDRLTLYIDGEPAASEKIPGDVNLSEGNLAAGRPHREPWRGYIRDIRVLDTALGLDGIRALMNRRPAPGKPELIAWWPLDEGAGERAHDRTGGGNHGTIHGAAWRMARARAGRRVSGPFRFPDIARVTNSRVDWRFEDGGDPDAVAGVFVGWSGRPDALPDEWHAAENGAPAPGLEPGEDLREKWLWLREEIVSPDPAADPALRDVTVTVQ